MCGLNWSVIARKGTRERKIGSLFTLACRYDLSLYPRGSIRDLFTRGKTYQVCLTQHAFIGFGLTLSRPQRGSIEGLAKLEQPSIYRHCCCCCCCCHHCCCCARCWSICLLVEREVDFTKHKSFLNREQWLPQL